MTHLLLIDSLPWRRGLPQQAVQDAVEAGVARALDVAARLWVVGGLHCPVAVDLPFARLMDLPLRKSCTKPGAIGFAILPNTADTGQDHLSPVPVLLSPSRAP